jgi:endoglucanase
VRLRKLIVPALGLLVLAGLGTPLGQSASSDTPAHQALKRFRKGANFGNYLEAPRKQDWGARYERGDLENVKSEGFDHVRLPIRWNDYTGGVPDFRIEPSFFARVDLLVTNALAVDLNILINIHHFDELTSNPTEFESKFQAIWRQIAQHYREQPNGLAFELLNEPKDAASTEVMNGIYEGAIQEIRKSNPKRTIFVGPGRWNSLDEVTKLKLPNDDNLIVTVHCYDPFLFTHQGASWSMPAAATIGIIYPGPPPEPITPDSRATNNRPSAAKWFGDYNRLPSEENPSSAKAFSARMEKVAAWAGENNRPIHLGEFGAYIKADSASRIRYYAEMRKTAERLGFGWAIWDWKAGFRYWDGNKPVEGMRTALFGR